MQLLASFVGKNRDFRVWLKAGMPANVVSLAEYRIKEKDRSREHKSLCCYPYYSTAKEGLQ